MSPTWMTQLAETWMHPLPGAVPDSALLEGVFATEAVANNLPVPVVDEQGKLAGVLRTLDIEKSRKLFELRDGLEMLLGEMLPHALSHEVQHHLSLDMPIDLLVREVMSVKIFVCQPQDPLSVVLGLFAHQQAPEVWVVDTADKPLGWISHQALLLAIEAHASAPAES